MSAAVDLRWIEQIDPEAARREYAQERDDAARDVAELVVSLRRGRQLLAAADQVAALAATIAEEARDIRAAGVAWLDAAEAAALAVARFQDGRSA